MTLLTSILISIVSAIIVLGVVAYLVVSPAQSPAALSRHLHCSLSHPYPLLSPTLSILASPPTGARRRSGRRSPTASLPCSTPRSLSNSTSTGPTQTTVRRCTTPLSCHRSHTTHSSSYLLTPTCPFHLCRARARAWAAGRGEVAGRGDGGAREGAGHPRQPEAQETLLTPLLLSHTYHMQHSPLTASTCPPPALHPPPPPAALCRSTRSSSTRTPPG